MQISNIQYTENVITSCWVGGTSLSIHHGQSRSTAHMWKHTTVQHSSSLITRGAGASTELTGSTLTPVMVGQLGDFFIICLWSSASFDSSSCILWWYNSITYWFIFPFIALIFIVKCLLLFSMIDCWLLSYVLFCFRAWVMSRLMDWSTVNLFSHI